MINQVVLRPVAEADLPLLHRLFTDPADTGEHEWHGWQDTRWLRRQWDEDDLLSHDRGMLMVACGDDALGYVGWHRRATGGQSSFWEIEIGLAPGARGHGHGTDAQRQLARYLFAHTRVNRVEAETEITNIAEQRSRAATRQTTTDG